jgi:hypothetical protein
MNDNKINYCLTETYKHVKKVQSNLNLFVSDLIKRGENHDNSKFEEPELSIFASQTEKLKDCVYGSDEYKQLLVEVKPAIDHHYSKNRHHPEHWPNGIEDMTLVDLLEMLADWKAATQRNKDGNIRRSILINSEKYKMSPQLRTIFENTVREYFKE